MESNKLKVDLSQAEWRKSRRSGSEGGNCVEAACNLPGVVAVRDSKMPDGPILIFGIDAWARFVGGVKGSAI
ncbi:DUF397 domain-containing protein [Sphaerisporangium sp. NPDC051017]|uniref:DUF397 domain-containing protein n=1 Tax=Sphaerisporangium sp. NPDC051017 TaxID=3154636 RepID=UPI00342ABDBC